VYDIPTWISGMARAQCFRSAFDHAVCFNIRHSINAFVLAHGSRDYLLVGEKDGNEATAPMDYWSDRAHGEAAA
jgi:hypothetical protein